MIVEQAFHYLPEILCGNAYPMQEYEHGIVGALSLAALQELNARNVANPLSCLQAERRYREDGVFKGGEKPRHLRADLFLDFASLEVLNRSLASYGFRENAWVEAKFFRDTPDKKKNTGLLLADLIRLITLVPDSEKPYSDCSRYLLHVYDACPTHHLHLTAGEWVQMIREPGPNWNIQIELEKSGDRIIEGLGNVLELAICADVSNTILRPQVSTDAHPEGTFVCILTRIDGFKVSMAGSEFGLDVNGDVAAGTFADRDKIAAYVSEGIAKKTES